MNYLHKELKELIKTDSAIFEFLQEGSLDGIWFWDLENPENEWMSPEFWETLGYDPLEMEHKANEWQDIINPDDLEIALDNFNKHCADKNHPYDQIVRYNHKDGSQVWVRCRGIAIRNEDGVPIRMLGAHNDLTQQFLLLATLSESELLQWTALNSLDEALHLIDVEFNIQLANTSFKDWCQNYGFDSDVIGKNLLEVFPFITDEVIDQYNQVIRTGKNVKTEETTHFDQQQITTETRKIPVISDGEVTGVLTIMADVTEEVEAKNALKEKENLLRSIAENYPDSYLSIIEKDFTIGFSSGREYLKQGLDPSQFVGLKTHQIFGEQEPFVRKHFDRTFSGEECFFELFINGQHQEYRTVPLPSRDGSITRILSVAQNISNRKKAERALSESEEKYRSIVEGSIQGMVIAQANPIRLSFASKPMEAITGYSPDELINFKPEDLQNLIHPDDRQSFFDSFQKRIKDEEVEQQAEYRIMHKKKGIRWVALFSSLISIKGEPATQTVFIDITERKLAEKSIVENEKKYRLLADNQADVVWTRDLDFKLTYISPSTFKQNGFTVDEKMKLPFSESVPPESHTLVLKTVSEEIALEKKGNADPSRSRTLYIDMYRKDGSIYPVETLVKFLRDENGMAVGLLGVNRDITERKQTEERLKASEYFFSQMFEQSIVSTQLLSSEGDTLRVNKPFCELFGVTPEAMKHYKIFEDDAIKESNAYEPLINVFNSKESRRWYNEFDIELASESSGVKTIKPEKVYLENLAYPVLDNKGNLEYVVIQHHNITDRKKAEERDKQQQYYLEKSQELGQIGTWELDLRENILRWTDENCRIFGVPPGSVVNYEIFISKVHPDDREFVDREWMASVAGKPYDVEHRLLIDGVTSWVRQKADLSFDENGVAVSAIGFTQDITERKMAEERLKASEYFFSQMFEQSIVSTQLLSSEGDTLRVNKPFCELFGVTPEAMKHYKIFEDDAIKESNAYEPLINVFNSKESRRWYNEFDIELASESSGVKTTKPEKVYLENLTYPVLDIKGNLEYVVIQHHNITDRKKAEEQVRLQSTALNAAANAIVITNNNGDIQWVNPAFTQLTGFSFEEAVGSNPNVLKSDEHDDSFYKNMWDTINSGEIWHGEIINKRKDGEKYFEDMTIAPLRYESGEISNFIAIKQDISERKRFEEILEKRIIALTRPLEDSDSIEFDDLFNLDDIQKLQDDFANASNVASIITKPNGTPITNPSNFCRLCKDVIRKTEFGLKNCYKSDASLGKSNPDGPVVQPCLSGGLWDAGASISAGGNHVANWLIGQVRDETQTEEKMIDYAREIGADEKIFLEAFREVPKMAKDEFHRISAVLFTLSQQLSTIAYQNVQQARFITEKDDALESLKTSQDQLRLLHEIDMEILAEETPESIASAIIKQLREFMDCQRAVILSYEENFTKYTVLASDFDSRFKDVSPDSGNIDKYSDIFNKLKNNEIFRISNLSNRDTLGKTISKLGIEETVLIPMMIHSTLIGAIALSYQDFGAFSEGDEELVRQVSNQLAIALQQAQLLENIQASRKRAKQLAKKIVSTQEDERQRISRELHDESGQMLTALKVQMELIQADLPKELSNTNSQILSGIELVTETMDNLRNLAHGLRPPVLDTMGLEITLNELCLDYGIRSGLEINFTSKSIPEMNDVSQITIFRIVQEALTNITKHSKAKKVDVQLNILANSITLSVKDDGVGFSVENQAAQNQKNKGIGIVGMSERLELIGGELSIKSEEGEGTMLIAEIPISQTFIERRKDKR